jgi:mannose PTS system EIIA component
MIGILIVTHGGLADELLSAARIIAGSEAENGIRALSLDWRVGLGEARQRIAEAVAAADQGNGVMVLTDMFGDTPSRAALALCQKGQVEVISGVNLPMVVRLACNRNSEDSLEEAARAVATKGRNSICIASERGSNGTQGESGGG